MTHRNPFRPLKSLQPLSQTVEPPREGIALPVHEVVNRRQRSHAQPFRLEIPSVDHDAVNKLVQVVVELEHDILHGRSVFPSVRVFPPVPVSSLANEIEADDSQEAEAGILNLTALDPSTKLSLFERRHSPEYGQGVSLH